ALFVEQLVKFRLQLFETFRSYVVWMTHGLTVPKVDCVGCSKPGKCCDFQPFLPNYLLRAMLEAGVDLPDAGEHHWQPIGLVPDKGYRERHGLAADGRRGAEFLCRFFVDRQCSIYQFRPAECRTYYCEGMTKWHHRKSEQGFETETKNAQLCLKQ